MIYVKYVPGIPDKSDSINIELTVRQASRLRDLLLKYEVEGQIADEVRAGLFHALVKASKAQEEWEGPGSPQRGA